jgi:hypothetical protein
MPGLRGGAPEQVDEEEEGTYLAKAERDKFHQNLESVTEHATAMVEHLCNVFYNRACGGVLTHNSGSNLNHAVTLNANVAGYVTLFKDFIRTNKKSGWWVSDPYFLAIASNLNRVGNLYANHLGHMCKKEQPAEDMSLNTYRTVLTKLLENLKSTNMRGKMYKGPRAGRL